MSFSILGIIIVDAWMAFQGEFGHQAHCSQRELDKKLALQLIFNKCDKCGTIKKKKKKETNVLAPIEKQS